MLQLLIVNLLAKQTSSALFPDYLENRHEVRASASTRTLKDNIATLKEFNKRSHESLKRAHMLKLGKSPDSSDDDSSDEEPVEIMKKRKHHHHQSNRLSNFLF